MLINSNVNPSNFSDFFFDIYNFITTEILRNQMIDKLNRAEQLWKGLLLFGWAGEH